MKNHKGNMILIKDRHNFFMLYPPSLTWGEYDTYKGLTHDLVEYEETRLDGWGNMILIKDRHERDGKATHCNCF